MDNSLKEIVNVIVTSFEKQKNQFPELDGVDLELIFKWDLVHFMRFCCVNETFFTPDELRFFNENLDLNLDYEYVQQYQRSVSDVNVFKLPSTFLIANIIDQASHTNELINTCSLFYQLFGQNYFQLRQFLPVTTDRFLSLMRDLEDFIQTDLSDDSQTGCDSQNDADAHTEDNSQTEEAAAPSLPSRTEENLKKCIQREIIS